MFPSIPMTWSGLRIRQQENRHARKKQDQAINKNTSCIPALGMYGDSVPTFCHSLARMDTVNVGSCSRLMGVGHTFPACLHWASGLVCRDQLLPL